MEGFVCALVKLMIRKLGRIVPHLLCVIIYWYIFYSHRLISFSLNLINFCFSAEKTENGPAEDGEDKDAHMWREICLEGKSSKHGWNFDMLE